jgi:hypothetical protein
VSVLIKSIPTLSTKAYGASNPSAVTVAATAAHVSLVSSHDPTYDEKRKSASLIS